MITKMEACNKALASINERVAPETYSRKECQIHYDLAEALKRSIALAYLTYEDDAFCLLADKIEIICILYDFTVMENYDEAKAVIEKIFQAEKFSEVERIKKELIGGVMDFDSDHSEGLEALRVNGVNVPLEMLYEPDPSEYLY